VQLIVDVQRDLGTALEGYESSAQGLNPDLYTQVASSGEAATHESLGRSPRNWATNEPSAESAAQMRRLCFAWRAKPKIATLVSFAPSALGSLILRFLGLRSRPKPAARLALGFHNPRLRRLTRLVYKAQGFNLGFIGSERSALKVPTERRNRT